MKRDGAGQGGHCGHHDRSLINREIFSFKFFSTIQKVVAKTRIVDLILNSWPKLQNKTK